MATKTTKKTSPKKASALPARAITDPALFPPVTTHHAVAVLARNGVLTGFYYDPAFPVADMNETQSALNQVRDNVYDTDHLEAMVQALKDDPQMDLPAVLLWKNGNLYINLDGNHRRKASSLTKRPTLPAIIVDLSNHADPNLKAQMIALNANKGNALPVAKANNLMSAADLHLHKNVSRAEAARTIGVSLATFSNFLGAARTESRVGILGIEPRDFEAIPVSARHDFNALNDLPFKDAMLAAAHTGMSVADIKAMMSEIKGLKSEAAQRDKIAEIRQTRTNEAALIAATGKKGRAALSPSTRLTNDLTRSIAKFKTPNLVGTFSTPAERETAIETLSQVAKDAQAAVRALRKVDAPAGTSAAAVKARTKAVTATRTASRSTAATAKAGRTTSPGRRRAKVTA